MSAAIAPRQRSISYPAVVGIVLAVGAFLVYWLSSRAFDGGTRAVLLVEPADARGPGGP